MSSPIVRSTRLSSVAGTRSFITSSWCEIGKHSDPVLQQLGIAFHSRQLDWGAQQRHNVGGNHMRWIRTSELQLDEAWRGELT